MRRFLFLLSIAIGVFFSLPFSSEADEAIPEAAGWQQSLEKPLTKTIGFYGTVKNNGLITTTIGEISNNITNIHNLDCGGGEFVTTPYTEVELVLDKTYVCTFSAENAYDIVPTLKTTPHHTLFNSQSSLENQPHLYKIYIFNKETSEWEKLCDTLPGFNAEGDNYGICANWTVTFEIQLRRDYGARPVSRPGLKAITGDEEPSAWSHEEGGVSAGSAPGDESPLKIFEPRNADTFSMSRLWEVSLGRLWSGGSAGRIRLQNTLLTTNDFSTRAVVYSSPTYDTNEVNVLTSLSDTNLIEQIKTPKSLVILTNTSSMSFEMRFYTPDYISGNDNDGFYTLSSNAVSFVTWKVTSGNGTTNDYRISEIRPYATNITMLTFTNASNLWTLTRGTGSEARIDTRTVTVSMSTNGSVINTNRLAMQEIKNGAGIVSEKTSEVYRSMPWNVFELVTITNDPGGSNLITAFTYYEDPEDVWTYQNIASIVYPDGYWERREYYDHPDDFDYGQEYLLGKLRYRVNPWKNSAINSPDKDCWVTEYFYDPKDDGRSYRFMRWHNNESSPTDWITWATHAERFNYYQPCQDETLVVEQHESGSLYGYGDWIETTTYTLSAGPLAGQLYSRRDRSDLMDSYDYIHGTYDASTRGFTIVTNGLDTQQLIYHGSHIGLVEGEEETILTVGESGYDIKPVYMAKKVSTKDVNLLDDGQLSLIRRYVFNGTTNYALFDEAVYQRDVLGHTTNVYRIDPATGQTRTLRQADWTGTNAFPGDLKLWDVDENGIKTTYTYDSLKRLKTLTKTGVAVSGYPSQQDITITFTYDASDRITTETTSGGNLGLIKASTYDKSGRVLTMVDEAGLTNNFGYQLGGRQVSTTNAAGGTKITLNYLDRRPYSVDGTAQVNEFYDYSIFARNMNGNPCPRNATTTHFGSLTSTRWATNITDQLDRPTLDQKPSFRNENVFFREYPTANWDMYGSFYETGFNGDEEDFIQEFDNYGRKIVAGWLGSGYWGQDSLSTLDRVHSFDRYFETNSLGHWFKVDGEWTHPIDNSDTAALHSMTKVRLTGFSSSQVSEILSFDSLTNQTTDLTSINLGNRLLTVTKAVPSSTLVSTQIVINGLLQHESTPSISTPSWHYYDSLGREIAQKDPLGYLSGVLFDPLKGQQIASTNRNGQVTTMQYYAAGFTNAGLLYFTTSPAGKKTYFNYNTRGQLTHTWGDVPYPEFRNYSEFGELVTLSTYRGGSAWNGSSWPSNPGTADVTTWNYDEPTGLLTNKVDALGQAVTFDYYPNNVLLSMTWTRGDGSTNYYNNFGDLVEVHYNVGGTLTTNLLSNYNRSGLPRLVEDASGSHVLDYHNSDRLLSDTCTNGIQTDLTVTYRYHQTKGKEMVKLATPSGSVTNDLAFDTYGRISAVTNATYKANYAYLAKSDLLSSTTSKSGASTVMTANRQWQFGYRLGAIESVLANGSAVDRHSYSYDALDRRTRAMLADDSAWAYDYNDRDEVTSAKRHWPDSSAVAGQQFEFSYDPIGNRTVAKEGGEVTGDPSVLRTENYVANALNQYTSRSVSGINDIIGAAYTTASLTVNGSANVHRKGEYFHSELAAGTSNNPVWQGVTNVATLNANSASEVGGLLVPPLSQTIQHDLDGNLTNDGLWSYAWDAENRLGRMSSQLSSSIADGARKQLDFLYDEQGRRVSKVVASWNGSSYVPQSTNRFVYDGWNLMAVLGSTNELWLSFSWGKDLSGTDQGAGGIGGLVSMTVHSGAEAGTYFYAYDGNGNVVALVKSDGSIGARYEYGTFGEILRASGSLAGINPFLWSTKFTDIETDLVYYGYRYYQPSLGRWLNRDPIGEEGDINLYSSFLNNAVSNIDALGHNTLAEQESVMSGGFSGFGNAGRQAWSIKEKVEDMVDAFNLVQQITSIIEESEEDESGELFIAGLQLGAQIIGNGIKDWANKPTVLYQLVDNDTGKNLKFGITSAKVAESRYTTAYLEKHNAKFLRRADGTRAEMLQIERFLHAVVPAGKLERQKWYKIWQTVGGLVRK